VTDLQEASGPGIETGRAGDPRLTRLTRSPSALFREVGEEVLLADVAGEGFDALSGAATAVWALLAGLRTRAELVAALADRYGVSEESIEADVNRLLDELHRRGWIQEVPADGA
jgi:hypothetical protein